MAQILKTLVTLSVPKLNGKLIPAHRSMSSIKSEAIGGNLPLTADPKEYG